MVRGPVIGLSRAETLARRSPRARWPRPSGGDSVIADADAGADDGREPAVATVVTATWRPSRVHVTGDAPADAGDSGRRVVSPVVATGVAMALVHRTG